MYCKFSIVVNDNLYKMCHNDYEIKPPKIIMLSDFDAIVCLSDWHYLGAEVFQKFTIFNIFLKSVYFTLFCLIILNIEYVFNNLKDIPTRKITLNAYFLKCK